MISLSGFGLAFAAINIALILSLPRRWVAIPFLVGACYMVLDQGIKIGTFNFFTIRLLIAAGVIRVVLRAERPYYGLNSLDRLVIAWAICGVVSCIFTADPAANLKNMLGLVFDSCGIYFLLRSFLRSVEDVVQLCRITVILLVPLAIEMLLEDLLGRNFFSFLGGVPDTPVIREGEIRAQGPFAHSILAGTVGAVCLPLAIGLWNTHKKTAIVGIFACSVIVLTSSSSGPIMSALFAMGALFLWYYRQNMHLFRWMAVLAYVVLDLVMNRPVYYLMASIDLTGGSTGWHRARLIESAFEHLDEWWLGGTDYTRHWMPTGVSWSPDHTDITNHYLAMGIKGGLLFMLLFIAMLVTGFLYVGRALKMESGFPKEMKFFVWALGASLAAHAASCISVSYFDQSFLFLYLSLALIASFFSAVNAENSKHDSGPHVA